MTEFQNDCGLPAMLCKPNTVKMPGRATQGQLLRELATYFTAQTGNRLIKGHFPHSEIQQQRVQKSQQFPLTAGVPRKRIQKPFEPAVTTE